MELGLSEYTKFLMIKQFYMCINRPGMRRARNLSTAERMSRVSKKCNISTNMQNIFIR